MQDFALARRVMIDSQLRPQGVTNRALLEAMAIVPREEFVPVDSRAFAYFDRAIPIGDKGAMMPPAPLARLLTAADPLPGEQALVVGAAPAYAAAVLEAMGLTVTTDNPSGAVDLLLVEGAIEQLPDTLADAVVDGGRVVTALVTDGVARLAIGRKASGLIGWTLFADSEVVPLPGYARPPAFSF